MKAVLFSIGTRGDIEPFLAIAQLLKGRHWDVLCVFPEQFRETVEGMDIRFSGFSREFLELLDGKDAKMFMGGEGSVFKRLNAVLKMAKAGMRLSREILSVQHNIQLNEKPDRVIYHPKNNYALVWGIANPGKSIMVSPVPFLGHPITHLGPLGNNRGRLLNMLNFQVVNTVKALVLKKLWRRYRKDYDGLKISVSSIKKTMLEKEKTFYTISPSLFRRPDYWPPHAKVVGYYERDKTVNWEPEEDLLKFLEKNKKIVFITFGSMLTSKPKEKSRMVVDVLRRNNIAAIINTSWGGLEETEEYPNNIYFVNNIPYDWIFPKMYAAIHHGGSGTTHTALKYACPCLVLPHILDQFFWSRTISGLKAGPEGMPIKNLDEEKFEDKLLDLMSNETYKTNATIISQKMKAENNPDQLFEMIIN